MSWSTALTATVEGFSIEDVNYAVLYNKVSYYKAFQQQLLQLCKEVCPDKSAKILVIGTRSGHFQHELTKYYTGEITGQDDSRSMIRELRTKYPGLKTLLMDPREKNVDIRRHYDLVICPDLYIYTFSLEDQRRIYEAIYSYKAVTGYVIMPIFDVENIQTMPREHSDGYIDEEQNVHAITYYDQFVYDTWFDVGEQSDTWLEVLKRDLFEMENSDKKKLHTTRYYVERYETLIHDLETIGYKVKKEWRNGEREDRIYLVCV